MDNNSLSALSVVVNTQLVGICFVLEYVTFQFEELVFAALAWPIISDGKTRLGSDRPGYRNKLCEFIGKKVISVRETIDDLTIRFETNTEIVVSLGADYPPGPEMATLSSKGHFLVAWLRKQ